MTPAQFRDLISLLPVPPSNTETAYLSVLGVLRCKILIMRGPDAPPNMREVGDALWACLDSVERELAEAIEDAKSAAEEAQQVAEGAAKAALLEQLERTTDDLTRASSSFHDDLDELIEALESCLAAAKGQKEKRGA